MDKRKLTLAAFVMLAGAAWAFGLFGGGDPVVVEMQQLRDELFANRDLLDDQRRAQWDAYRQRMEGLTDAQRDALRAGGRERWQQFGQQRMDEFFQLPPDQQQQRLDEFIDRMLARQQVTTTKSKRRPRSRRTRWLGRPRPQHDRRPTRPTPQRTS